MQAVRSIIPKVAFTICCHNMVYKVVYLVLAQLLVIRIILRSARFSLCGAGISILAISCSTSLARAVIAGPLEPTLILTSPTTSALIIATSVRPTTTLATTAVPFAALSLLHSPSLGRRRREGGGVMILLKR